MQLYNTLSRQVEPFEPFAGPDSKQVGLYACGFTVYDYTHIGHLRKYSMDDVLVRVLRHAGYQVKFVQNVTDVGHLSSDGDTGEDKLEKGAKKYKKTVWDIAHEFEDYFFRSMDLMGNLRPDVSCRATEHIAEQIEMVKTLEKKGFTYVIEGDGVYFDSSKFPSYGELAKLDVEALQAGARVEMVEGKRGPTDFALWKFERPGEDRSMVWESPWAKRGFPGWHIECSAMAMKYLGEQFEVHTGGIDHIPVHHTNEIAQAEAATGKKPFVKYWVHHNFITIDGEKMSKSLGNFFTVDDLLKRGHSPRALRLLFLTSHYRSSLNFTWDSLAAAQKSYDKLVSMVRGLRASSDRVELSDEKLSKVQDYRQRFFAYLYDDLRTPEAVAVMWEMLKSNIPSPDKADLLLEFDAVLALGLQEVAEQTVNAVEQIVLTDLNTKQQALVQQRVTARNAKDWTTADRLRTQLLDQGIEMVDGAQDSYTLKRV